MCSKEPRPRQVFAKLSSILALDPPHEGKRHPAGRRRDAAAFFRRRRKTFHLLHCNIAPTMGFVARGHELRRPLRRKESP
jgi:hypothetical protein